MAVDLTDCDREPIHIPGSIQPHGILFRLSQDDLLVSAISENAVACCGRAVADLLGAPLSDLIDGISFDQIRTSIPPPGETLRLTRLRLSGSAAISWRGILHANDDGLLLEAEQLPAGADIDALDHFAHFHNAILRLQAARGFDATCENLVGEVRKLTGYSRVMLYRFASDWSGEVVAEDQDGTMPPFAGLHFPASDIPVQARALYARNAERQIPDVAYIPAKIVQAGTEPLDLGQVGLRSVSPVHLAYLRNMAVGAAMSVSLLRNGRLWGMVACHHPTAHLATPEKIQSCVLLSQIAVARFGLIEEAEVARHHVAVKAMEARLMQQAADAKDRVDELLQADLLRHNSDALFDLLGANAVVLSVGGQVTALGEAPQADDLHALIKWLATQGQETLATDHLSAAYPATAKPGAAAGLLAVPLGSGADDFIIWLRPEIARTVTWAGNPIKTVEQVAGGERLTPRQSFAAWTEQVSGWSRPWTANDIAAAHSLRDTLMEILARRAAQIQRMNLQLLRSNEELESFAYIASHDLKEPLRQIEMFGTLLQRAFNRQGDPAEKIERWFAGIATSSQRLRGLIDHLAQYSRLGSEARTFAPADTARLLAEVLQDFHGQIAAAGCILDVGSLPVVTCDAIQVRQVLQNLVGNALKYRHPDRPLILRITAEPSPPPDTTDMSMVAIRIEDNGIGFDERYREQIFRPFERLHSVERYEGSGLGLAICRKVIDRHGGTITASSSLGAGAVFTFTLPHRAPCGQGSIAA